MGWIKQGGGVSASLSAGTPGATSVVLTLTVDGGTLDTWSLNMRSRADAESEWSIWSTIQTMISGSNYTVTGLDPAPAQYEFQPVDVIATSTTTGNYISIETQVLLYRSEVIMLDGYTDATFTNESDQTYAIRITNNGSGPIYGVRIHGRNTISNHATIKGCVLGSGNVNNINMVADNYIQATFNGQSAFSPSDGGQIISSYWLTDDLDFPSAIQEGESGIVRLTVASGAVSYAAVGNSSSRANFGDVSTGWATTTGDFGSDPTHAANIPSWNAGVSVLPFGFVIKRDASSIGQRHAAFGDSIIEGVGNGYVRDRWIYTATSGLSNNRRITSFGRGGFTVQSYCQLFESWLNTQISSLFESCSISGWSWNNIGDETDLIILYLDSAIAAGIAAGKRMSVWFPVPAGLQTNGYGNQASLIAVKAHCVSQGYNVIDTSEGVTDVDGIAIKSIYTPDGVHLNEAGQDIMGAALATKQALIFGS